jgi:hypothetical protein
MDIYKVHCLKKPIMDISINIRAVIHFIAQ